MMQMRWPRCVAVCAVLALGCQSIDLSVPPWTSTRLSDHQQIAMVLEDVQEGMQTGRIYKVLAHVSPYYQDDAGRDFDGIKQYLATVFDNYRNIRITRADPRIIVRGHQAEAIETFGTRADPVKPDGLDIHQEGEVTVYLEQIGGAWKIREWSRLR